MHVMRRTAVAQPLSSDRYPSDILFRNPAKWTWTQYMVAYRSVIATGNSKTFFWQYQQDFWEELIAYFPLMRHGPHVKWRAQQFFYCCMYSFPRNVFTKPLPSNNRVYTYRHTDWCEESMMYSVDMGSSFIRIGSGIIKLRGGDTYKHTDSKVIS
jgi:hypothetical protein